MTVNHTVKIILERKLDTGEAITADDVESAKEYAKAFCTNQARALFAKVKRASTE